MSEGEREALAGEPSAVIKKMLATRRAQLASCERMLELLKPEWDKFEARTGHDTYVARDYADHFSAARTHRKEIDALAATLAALTAPSAEDMREALKEISAAHLPDQPATSSLDETEWATQHIRRMRAIARAALKEQSHG